MFEGSRENRDPDWEGSNVSNRKHDPAMLRLYLASVAMCWECTLQTHTRAHTHFTFLQALWLMWVFSFLVVINWWSKCERTREEHVEGGFHRCVRYNRPQSLTATSEFFPWFPAAAAFLGRHGQQTCVVRRQQWETYMFSCMHGSSSSSAHDHSSLCSPH